MAHETYTCFFMRNKTKNWIARCVNLLYYTSVYAIFGFTSHNDSSVHGNESFKIYTRFVRVQMEGRI